MFSEKYQLPNIKFAVSTHILFTRLIIICEHNIQAHLCNYCCSGKAALHISSMFVTSGIQHAMRIILSSVACPALRFSTLITWLKKKLFNITRVSILLYNFCLQHFSFYEELSEIWWKMYTSIHVNTHYFCHILMKLGNSWRVFKKYSNIKFHENPSSGSRVVPCRQTDGHDKANSYSLQLCKHA